MKNICFIAPDFSVFGGAEKVLYTMALDLCENYNVYIVSIWSASNKTIGPLPDNINYFVLQDGPIRRKVTLYPKKIWELIRYINKSKINVVFLMGSYPAVFVSSLKPFTKAKYVFCDHSSLMSQWDIKRIRNARKHASKWADKTIVLTKKSLADYKEKFGIKDSKIDYIYNYIDEAVFKHSSDKYATDSKKIVTAGRFGPEKGFDMLVDVAAMVFKRHPDWVWDLFGDGEELEKIKDLISKKNLKNNLILKGRTENMYDKYKDYSMYVLTSYREGLPLVLLEAKANRLPIVSFNVITGPSEIVQDNIDGFLIDCYDKEQMADKICTLIENKDLREQFSCRSYDNLDVFKKENILNKWTCLIDSLS